MAETSRVIFVHGLGDSPASWAQQISTLPAAWEGVAIDVPGLGAAGEGAFSLERAARRVVEAMDERGWREAVLCGLSLGAMIALRAAVDFPERVRGLVLAAGQVRPPRALLRVQNALIRVLPARAVASGGVDKSRILSAARAVMHVDFGPDLARIACPTLVLCGSRDRANLPASRRLAAEIPGARLAILEGAGHQSNTQSPESFSAELNRFLGGPAGWTPGGPDRR
ncbi:alpha/beta fold hydrolase [Leucobacter weissii]|uniref:Alpha/beta fold hydrolase n=1 Tax=Leucobacter weissii TaxID=1983706 RepID=A0A939S5X6_9MICO|nr:alpha/beta fold hydrolase [Leucobacter weissii]MBO1901779.1 alpha/beta fold hydrolase [Leucobacter weissii]